MIVNNPSIINASINNKCRQAITFFLKFTIRLLILALFIFPQSFVYANEERNIDSVTVELKKNQNLNKLLESIGINKSDANNAVIELNNVYGTRNFAPGQKFKVTFEIMDTEGNDIRFLSMEAKISLIKKVEVNKLDNNIFFANVFESKAQPKLVFIRATVGATLFSAAMNAGISRDMFNELVKAYSYDVDFQRDVVTGNEMDVLYEGLYDDEGKLVSSGDILYTSLKVNKGKFSIFRYTTPDGVTDFYNEDGISVQKSLLKTPVNGAHISSNYGSRKHPILGFTKIHKGVDFAAPTGTPVYAAGDGVVIEARHKGSYGKYINIFHNGTFSTAYAHLNGYAKYIQRGSRVTQGQIIGYVGSTGRSTGAHLHYEVIEKGAHVNPLTIKTGAGKKLDSKEKEAFLKRRNALLEKANSMAMKIREPEKIIPR